MMKKSVWRRAVAWVSAIATVLALAVGAMMVYVNDYYRADTEALAAMAPMDMVTKEVFDDGAVVYMPENIIGGLIFYPGGKVEHTAYEPLMQACASRGILCVLPEMPWRLAVLDVHAADGWAQRYPQVKRWYIGGHSLGGSMAAAHVGDRTAEYEGLLLLGSYATADLSDASLSVLSIYGSEDRVMDREAYAENKANLPADVTEMVIEGGCHAYFGAYGSQDGDGMPMISRTEQIRQTADAIVSWIYQK